MGTRQFYSVEFKDAVVSKIMNRGGKTIAEVCEQEGIRISNAKNWLRDRVRVADMPKNKSPRKWSAEDKLKVVNETHLLSEEELGKYLRREGLYSHQVAEWRSDVLKSLDEARTRPQAPKRDERDDRIKELERDLSRMEKALAEASARMMLQKKADLFWANRAAEKK